MYILYLCLRILYLCVLTFLVFSSLFAFLASSVREQMLPPAWPYLDPRVDEIPAVALSTCVLAPGCSFWSLWWLFQVSVVFRGAELFTGAALSFQMVFPVIPAWPSVPCTSAASEQTSFPVGILGSCNTKMLLKGYWSSKLCSFLSAMSVTSPEFSIIMFQFHAIPLGILFLLPWCSLICPRLFSMGYLSHLDLPISLLPLWSPVRGRGSWHSPPVLAFPGMSLCIWGTGKGVMLLA